MKLKNKMQKN